MPKSGISFNFIKLHSALKFVVWTLCFLSQTALAKAERLPFMNYTVADGLAHGSVLSIYQDHKGFLWFGTFEGLSLFDGYAFVNYGERDGLPTSFINDIAEDRQGRLWVATNGGGVARLVDQTVEPNQQKFVSYQIRGQTKANNVNRILFDSNDFLWCLTDYGLYRADMRNEQLRFETIIEKSS